MKKWIPVLVGFVAGLCFGIWWFFQSINTNSRPPFFAEPVIWVVNFLRPLGGPGRRDLTPVVVLLWFIYCSFLGALLGFLFQLALYMFRRLKHHDAA
jgi:hypothetical protein